MVYNEFAFYVSKEELIHHLIREGQKENTYIDYKACGSLRLQEKDEETKRKKITMEDRKAELAKDVSAFANAGGGTLIYGVKENKQKKPTKIDDDAFPLDGPINTEWF